ncbi:carboxymuconolactone decarboxylase family protein [Pseudomonas sp. BIC9C]|uniref:carboxymuconolactone decarboxylase family protein n=1 Tax=Pseudomonas sp. BIC9C TaxID=3078458 RepID=UPI002AD3C5D1|nr:carboxymuconolactone decarboxylase family protein [Pseudomonas sp. BIC9C]
MLAADKVLSEGPLSKPDQETIKLVISELAGCDYCVAAHSMVGKLVGLSPDAMHRIREGQATGDSKQDALVTFVYYLALCRKRKYRRCWKLDIAVKKLFTLD